MTVSSALGIAAAVVAVAGIVVSLLGIGGGVVLSVAAVLALVLALIGALRGRKEGAIPAPVLVALAAGTLALILSLVR